MTNAYILDWAMDGYGQLKMDLNEGQFQYEEESGTNHIRVSVSLDKLKNFVSIVQKHLSAPCNYVDIQFPDEGITVIIFSQKIFKITNSEQNNQAKQWAIGQGLPVEQANWGISYHTQ